MPDSLIEQKNTLIKRLRKAIASHPNIAQAELFETFIGIYFKPFPADLIVEKDEKTLFALALNHWQLLLQQKKGKPLVRVYTPRADRDGWESPHLVIQAVVDDMPFLIDSVSTVLNEHSLTVHLATYPGISIGRSRGKLTGFDPVKPTQRVVALHFEVDRRTQREALEALRQDLESTFEDIRLAVNDWPAMHEKMKKVIGALDALNAEDPELVAESSALLNWLSDDHFTFLGYREYKLVRKNKEDHLFAVEGSSLGTARHAKNTAASETFDALPQALRATFRDKTPLIITKSHIKSRVHRAVHMDYIGVKQFNKQGNVVGEHRFLGLFTAAFYNLAPTQIPLVRTKIEAVMKRTSVPRDSHDGKALLNIMQNYPRDDLLQIDVPSLHANTIKILGLRQRQRSCLFIRREPFGRFVSCLVYTPRERFSTEVRRSIQQSLMETFNGVSCDLRVSLSESIFAQVYLMIHTPKGQLKEANVDELEAHINELTRSWTDDLESALLEHFGEEKGSKFSELYKHAFPAGYRETFDPRAAAWDVEYIEQVRTSQELQLALYRYLEDDEGILRFKMYSPGGPLMLSDVLPVLENMGVRVAGETPYAVRPSDGCCVQMHDFTLRHTEAELLDSDQLRESFQEAFANIWAGKAESDGFNRLVLRAGLSWREVAMLRAYARYLGQTDIPFSQAYMESTLLEYPEIVQQIARLFRARLDPARRTANGALTASLNVSILEALDKVSSLDADRILRGLFTLVQTTLRSNYFQREAAGREKPYLSFKLDPALIPDLPDPRPEFEIFVYSPRVEGVHLRGGKVARGGLRWSDRQEDFRTEILGLVKAQMVKNSIIVPVGAKGGFIVRQLPDDPAERRREVEECYKTFIRGLLDITDNIIDGEIIPPPSVVRHDGDDPYLVVAADKGTATFSDTANSVAAEYGFWLGDAFASGGSVGYDHKAMGITARGAWEAVKRHFREMNIDCQNEDFTVIGVGDMSGDVFGNGMLLSEHTRLIAAFDHRDIFIDPDPDAATSFAERKRLFDLPRSSWADYDKSLISKGGGVYSRKTKSIRLSKAARTALGTDRDNFTPNELIRAILRAPVDLFWNGGIGTYVRASTETDADVGDRSNDAVRISANELRCKVVGEGGNLGLTQLARIEYGRLGGRSNTDAIDNAGGVNCSDHEVNIKILLDRAVKAGDLTLKQRNKLLRDMTDTVAELVISENYWQTAALSFMHRAAPTLLDEHRQFIENMAAAGKLNPALEFLPDGKAFDQRKAAGEGLTRPELSVILSYASMGVYQALLESNAPEDPFLQRELIRYFPRLLREPWREYMLAHPLKREIIATFVTNRLINRLGATFVFRLADEHEYEVADITRAYLAVWEIFSLRELWFGVSKLDNKVSTDIQAQMIARGVHLIHRATLWLLRNGPTPIDIEQTAREFGPCGEALISNLEATINPTLRETIDARIAPLLEAGVPDDLARRTGQLDALHATFDVHTVSVASGLDLLEVARINFGVEELLNLGWLRRALQQLRSEDRWEERARSAMADDLDSIHQALTRAVAAEDNQEKLAGWREKHEKDISRYAKLVTEIRNQEDQINGARIAVVLRALRALV